MEVLQRQQRENGGHQEGPPGLDPQPGGDQLLQPPLKLRRGLRELELERAAAVVEARKGPLLAAVRRAARVARAELEGIGASQRVWQTWVDDDEITVIRQVVTLRREQARLEQRSARLQAAEAEAARIGKFGVQEVEAAEAGRFDAHSAAESTIQALKSLLGGDEEAINAAEGLSTALAGLMAPFAAALNELWQSLDLELHLI